MGRRVPAVGEGGPSAGLPAAAPGASPHSQLVDEDVGHPDALHREGDLRQVVEARRVPPEELVRPVLGDKGEGLGGQGPCHPAGTHTHASTLPWEPICNAIGLSGEGLILQLSHHLKVRSTETKAAP